MVETKEEYRIAQPVVFLSRVHANTTFIVARKTKIAGRAADGVPIVEIAGNDKVAAFRNGTCHSSDPEVIAFLDGKDGVVRADDPFASLKLEHGEEEIAKIEEAVRARLQKE